MTTKRKPTLLEAISGFLFMAVVIGVGFGIYGISIQILLIVAAAYAAWIGLRVGLTWAEMEEGISVRIGKVMPAIFILFSVGIIVGSWMYAGTVPMLIYYGLKIISPTYFLVTAFIIVAVVSVGTGTAWGSTATAGVALMGIASQIGIPLGMAAGAVIAGGVFGDKLSPLSDTTNLAPLVTGVQLFEHIRHMLYTTLPAALIGIIVYLIAGFSLQTNSNADLSSVQSLMAELDSIFHWNIWMLLPFAVIFWGAWRKHPTVPIMLFSSVVAVVVGMFSNRFAFADGMKAMTNGFDIAMIEHAGLASTGFSETVLSLLNRGGLFSMTTIAITIICGYAFAGIMEVSGSLDVILQSISKHIQQVWQLIGVTIIGSVLLVFTAGVASISIIMVGTLLAPVYDKMGLHRKNLSRTLEDAGTMLLPFVPWGVSGIFYLEILGVGVWDYGIWTVASYLCIVFAMIYAFTGFSIQRTDTKEKQVA